MAKELYLRPAGMADADQLLDWRNDPQTRSASHSSKVVGREEHLAWLKSSLENKDRMLMIAVEDEVPVGTVRADLVDGVNELSWSVATSARGRGVGKRMVAMLASQLATPIRAEIQVGNEGSIKIAEFAGMLFHKEEDGVMHYRRDRRKGS